MKELKDANKQLIINHRNEINKLNNDYNNEITKLNDTFNTEIQKLNSEKDSIKKANDNK